ncbi:glycosyltransferase family 2 protein [Postia placenta MAD-698-R-SB12]|uniref:chitin synthase n=1 Tax=Postia placenta MAD-698-R-SB12 TaxID=670580 RepID=A0A1X6NDT7_9APHY|nr:glycosyltransferase family 2 protein [Postia placenta MAD-698-R-SB12]OSX66807.1 glycosyltransferase family 2 protein [Postia placenta MAD-698-R-SB12]
MDRRGQRPPRSARPPQQSPPADYEQHGQYRPPLAQTGSSAGISFRENETGDRHDTLDPDRQRAYTAYNNQLLSPGSEMDPAYAEAGGVGANVGRKKSLVRPDREKIEPGHRLWHYRNHAAQMEDEGGGNAQPSTTGNAPQREQLRRGKSILGREEDVHESGLALFKRGTTLRRKKVPTAPVSEKKRSCMDKLGPGPKGPWFMYCYIITCLVPPPLLRACGIRTPEQIRAWREKMGLMTIIACLMAVVGFITFGFTRTVCGTPPNRYHIGSVENSSVIIHGYDYDFSDFHHPAVGNFDGNTNPLLVGNWHAAGADISFMFQQTGGSCSGYFTKAGDSTINGSTKDPEWYFPCNVFPQGSTANPNETNYGSSTTCHTSSSARQQLASMSPKGQVYYTWDDLAASDRNLAVYDSIVLDFDLLKWLNTSYVQYPSLLDELKQANGTFNGKDLTMWFQRANQHDLALCLQQVIKVGYIDTDTIGCVASEIVLYVSLVFIIGVVGIRFAIAIFFFWFISSKVGNYGNETYQQRRQRMMEIEDWTNDIYKPAPSGYRPNVYKNGVAKNAKRKTFLPSTSRFTPAETMIKGGMGGRTSTAYGMLEPIPYKRAGTTTSMYGSNSGKSLSKLVPPDTPGYRNSKSSISLATDGTRNLFTDSPCPFPLHNVVPQPPPDYEPFNFPLAHTICLVTAYSESVEGLRTTLDSLVTTDYPNSHKVILIVADGMVKGAGNSMTTPEICITMMKEFITPPEEVEAHSYVAIADGHKRHNMAKVYAGYYDYDNATIEITKQQRVPVILVAKVGNPLEAGEAKPGNRGKRDSQIVLMSFMQKVMFDERMTTFEYEFFNSIWRVTGISPDRYEMVLCVDADTKVFPDSLSRLVACMVQDYEVMGICGETKIANKSETWVTMIQVFEYFISHHMTKAFESTFGSVTCLPGCFSMYRIKSPKGESGYWVPILANPDIVEHYSENIVDTLHKKNLLLLGEDRYLTTLLLKTFPKRKNIFCASAVCKTIVPDTFGVLLSQRRRWINSTVHNLAELVQVRDMCGTFCFSMQFVVGMELVGTLVLPAAISFTLYLIIESIVPHHPNTTIPLVLLAMILGLPGVLIVVTSFKVAYVGWMVIYLLSLPIWNGVLPAYSFWHFDDFSWGQTRMVAGEKAGDAGHGDKEGEFDSTHIVMKRWAEFERERRWKSGSQSRDSTVFDYRSNSPKRRPSLSSTAEYPNVLPQFDSDTYESSSFAPPRPRKDSSQLLMLPAPLSVNRTPASVATASVTTSGVSRSSDEGSDLGSSRGLQHAHQSYSSQQYAQPQYPQTQPFEARVARTATANSGAIRHATSPTQYPGETYNPYGNQGGYIDEPYSPFATNEPDEISPVSPPPPPKPAPTRSRGVSLADNGPTPGPGGVRRVSRQTGRRASAQAPQAPAQNRYSRSSTSPYGNLPPGAAPPQQGYGY